MWHYKKKDILIAMGKWEKDVRALDRAIRKGRVIYKEEDGISKWITREDYDNDIILNLRGKIKSLEEEVLDLKKKSEASVNAEYYEDLYNKEVEDKDIRIRKCYDWIRSRNIRIAWDEFHEWVMWDSDE